MRLPLQKLDFPAGVWNWDFGRYQLDVALLLGARCLSRIQSFERLPGLRPNLKH